MLQHDIAIVITRWLWSCGDFGAGNEAMVDG